MNDKITVSGEISGSINFAMQQNYVPLIRNLSVNNSSDELQDNLKLKITFEPNFANEFTYDIGSIEPNTSVRVFPVNIILSTEFLFSLSEKIVGTIFIELLQNEKTVFNYTDTVELLAYDEWSGLLTMPEIITAFVTPNHPLISEVLSKASEFLKEWDKNPSFTGYQTNNQNNVKIQMAAIYAALRSQKIIYNNPPASYETLGQRIRLPHKVLEEKQGTCLDLSVLYAACLEAAGLFPLLIFIKGHVFCGCWLEQQTFSDCAVDDVSAIEKRIVPGNEEILLVECTNFTNGNSFDFEHAIKHGNYHLSNPTEFQYVIDVQRSRESGIRPIPVKINQSFSCGNISSQNKDDSDTISAPKELNISDVGKIEYSDSHLSRIQIWERKLLDFSLRNTLLNFRVTKKALQLMTSNLAELEDRLSDNEDFRIMEAPSEWSKSVRDAKMYEIENQRDLIENIAAQELKNNRIRTFLPFYELEQSLKDLYRNAKLSIEENGTNTMFLALGFLRWFESDVSEKARYAPIVLVPVDIVKSSRNKGYIIRSRQEEAQINITLIEYLRQIFGLKIPNLDPLPLDEHGTNLPLVFNTIREAIMDKKRWNIENLAFLGLFSFGQFVMWNDLHNRSQELKSNKVVSSLIDKKLNWNAEPSDVTIDNLDSTVSPENMAVPLSADSSQLLAIYSASTNNSFVLHGPPGTGKSQTITNMIANALYQGKSVLFVAEKMAALNVVQKRLASIGLDPFCLELHSNKTNKTGVLSQLNKSLEVGRIKSPDDYKSTAEQLHNMRSNLNQIIEGLHCKRRFGKSIYEAIEIFEEQKEHKNEISFSQELILSADEQQIQKWNALIRKYVVELESTANFLNHPLKNIRITDYSIDIRENIEQILSELISGYTSAKKAFETLAENMGIKNKYDFNTVNIILKVNEIVLSDTPKICELLKSDNFDNSILHLKTFCSDGMEYSKIYKEISDSFDIRILNYDADEAVLQWREAQSSWFLPKLLKKSKLKKELKSYSKNPDIIDDTSITQVYDKLSELKSLKNKIETDEFSNAFTEVINGIKTDWEVLSTSIDKTVELHDSVNNLTSNEKSQIADSLHTSSISSDTKTKCKILKEYIEKWTSLKGACKLNESIENSPDWFMHLNDFLKMLNGNIYELGQWTSLNKITEILNLNGLSNVTQAVTQGKVLDSQIENSFNCNLYYSLILSELNNDERLKTFRGNQYEEIIAQYHKLIDKFRSLTIQELVAKLSAKIPVSGKISLTSSEIGILKRAIKSNGRMMSIRKLFNEIPNLLRRLCPCMLMSPISVAQYIDPSFPKFDLVIFDEASQIPTCEAVGTIARGENVVIVGDPKQLPPTSFFASNRIDEDNIENEDLESLLDDCLAVSMPQEYLKWHYRSRHESLIAYSNMQYYDNKLYTFPSPNDLVSEVSLIHVDGYYDKGKTKQNKAEALAVVNEIIRRLNDDQLKNDSIGVVTFSVVQQNLIDDMLSEEFAKHPELEEQNKNSAEPLFIKNLENVQGDERDVILFSIGYGPDKDGKVSMNFGPLNRDGGWRRLNVAISRARKSMIVYSTITPEQIDLSRTRSDGVAGLKGFLEFASRGKNVITLKSNNVPKVKDALVEKISKAIVNLGYKVKHDIGYSEYKMDIGVVNSNDEQTYILGILLDGKNCKNSATAKDRFVLQPDILTGLGWNIMRVWSLDWLDNSQKVIDNIAEELNRSVNKSTKNSIPEITTQNVPNSVKFEKLDLEAPENSITRRRKYQSLIIKRYGTPENFYEVNSNNKIRSLMINIIEAEAPISKKALFRKVLSAWGITRSGNKVESILNTAITFVDKRETSDNRNTFYWTKNQNPNEYAIYRVEDQNDVKRSIDDISSYEILNAIIEVLNEQISLNINDLIKETAKKLGYSRIGTIIVSTIKNAIMIGQSTNTLKISDDEKVCLC